MKMYAIVFMGSFYAVSLCAMQENQQVTPGHFLSIQKRMEELRHEQQSIQESDIDHQVKNDADNKIQAELQRLDYQMKLHQDIQDGVKKLRMLVQDARNKVADAEWEIEG